MAAQTPWYAYPLSFLGGGLAVNSLPHLVHGVSGEPFPSPFADPPGRGDSPPLHNVAWASANLAMAAIALTAGRSTRSRATLLTAVGGGALMAVGLARFFGDRTQ